MAKRAYLATIQAPPSYAATPTAAGAASLNIPHGTAPATPVNGDVWTTTAGTFIRINGSTKTMMDLETDQTVTGSKTFSGRVHLLAPMHLYVNGSNPASPETGDIYYNDSALAIKYYDGAGWDTLMDLEDAQTVTGTKTFATSGIKVGQTTLAQGVNGTITFPASAGTLALNDQTFYIGTTSVAINRASALLALTGIQIEQLKFTTVSSTTYLETQGYNWHLQSNGGSGSFFGIDYGGSFQFSGNLLALAASTTTYPSLRIPHGTAPSSPTNGDVWTTTAGTYVRINSLTKMLRDQQIVTFTPSTVGWYRVISTTASVGGLCEIDASYDNTQTDIAFHFDIAAYGTDGSIQQVRHSSYNGGCISQARISSDGGANVYLDLYVSTSTSPGPITVIFTGPRIKGLVASPTVGATVGSTDATVIALRHGFIQAQNTTASDRGVLVQNASGTNVVKLTADGTVTATTFSGSALAGSLLSSSNPVINGTAAPGTATVPSRQDHVHPTDTSRAAVAQTMYVGTTSVAINRSSAALTLAGITLTNGVLDNIVGSSASATVDLWQGITDGYIHIGRGLTTGGLNLAVGGTGANYVNIGNSNTAIQFNGSVTAMEKVTTVASTTAHAGFRIPSGSAPTSGTASVGDMWLLGTGRMQYAAGASTYITIAAVEGQNTFTAAQTFNTYMVTMNAGLVVYGDRTYTAVPTTSYASLNLPHGAAPSSPQNGDVWTTTAGMYVRINGTTVGPLGTGGGGSYVDLTTNQSISGVKTFNDSPIFASGSSGQPNLTIRNTNVDGIPSYIEFVKAPTDNTLADGDRIGSINSIGVDTTGATQDAATLDFVANAANTASTAPGRIVFSTTNTSGSYGERMRIGNGVVLSAATSTSSPLNIPHGTAPSSPTNGDIWTTTAGVYARINGTTVGPFGSGSSGNSPAENLYLAANYR